MSKILSKIKSFFIIREEKSLQEFFREYLKIRTELAVSDINVSDKELNFKVAWRGNLVPFWISSRYQVSDVISIIAIALALGMNLVEISQELKKYGIDS